MDTRSQLQDRGEDTSRMRALSDCIFAVAFTLLVLDLRLPESISQGSLAQAILLLWPKFWSYGLTFAVVGALWISHHRMLHLVARYDRTLLWLNLLFLSLVALVPFPTSLIGRFSSDLADAQIAWTAYSLNIILVGLSLFGMWRYALAHALTVERITSTLARYLGDRTLVAPAVFSLSIGLCRVSPPVAYLSPILIPPVMAFVHRAYDRRGAARR